MIILAAAISIPDTVVEPLSTHYVNDVESTVLNFLATSAYE
ncbi:hypothetical protein [Ligilactobacillus salivarius]|uniref:Uncharacterized protein n=1 Tax=Ligilactobacillus salivarius TaxID=1624 RepID=A0AAW6Q5C8_9LACO|nr:hypothetical protein [Ligilactobacillus salivarius]MDF4187192.1 hypothetical protein [Ligilactobacillus salivarius]MDM8284354.1 hypothetical protein [Ligilactobacillus salivarius]